MSELNNVIPFEFDDQSIRVLRDENGETWFVAMEIAGVLEYSDAHEMTQRLDDDEKQNRQIAGFGPRGVTLITESGLFSAILTSRKPEAKRFKRWVTHEVLPAIRRTGAYEVPEQSGQGIFSANPNHIADAMVAADRIFRSVMRTSRMAGVRQPRALVLAREASLRHTGFDLLAEILPEDLPLEPALPEKGDAVRAEIPQTSDERFLSAWRNGETPYPVCPCRSVHLYEAYLQWCSVNDAALPRESNRFLHQVGRIPGWESAPFWVFPDLGCSGKPHKRFRIIVPAQAELERFGHGRRPEEMKSVWMTRCYLGFAAALAETVGA